MPKLALKILPTQLLDEYIHQVDDDLLRTYEHLKESELSIENFSFYTSVSAVFSSKIEGEPIELDSYIKHKRFGIEFLPDYTQKIDDLYNAYQFAQTNHLNQNNISIVHGMLTAHILPSSQQGKTRTSNMYVTTTDGRIEYVAAQPAMLSNELDKFYNDIALVMDAKLTLPEIFYFAALIHLTFVKIHPFDDGNGRTARLLEKWFLGAKLGSKAWLIQSEKLYYQQHQQYYTNLRKMGLEYEQLDYEQSLPFLLMLPQSLALSK